MLKINLLPKSINIARQRNIAIGVVTLLVAAEVGAVLFMRNGPQEKNRQLTDRQTQAQQELTELNSIKSKADEVLGKEQALAPKYDFLTNMVKYNKQLPSLYRRIAAYTYSEATLLNLEASANQVKFDAYVANPTDVGRLLLGLSRSPDIQGLPAISGVPGWDEAEEAKRRADEKKQEASENLPGAGTGIIGGVGGAGAPGGGVGGYPGMGSGGGYPGMESSAGGGYPGMESSGGGYPGGKGMPGPAGMSGGGYPGGMGSSGGYPGGSGGGGGGGDIGKFKLDNARRKPRGFTVNVTFALRTPLAPRPSYGDSDTQAGGGGGGGGFGGYPGGNSGGFGGGGYPGGGPGGPGGNGP
jgi:Tfp pilus assembly protein PilN